MPPKPFKPPRPSNSASTSGNKKSATKPRKSTSSSTFSAKSKLGPKPRAKTAARTSTESAASRLQLPSLSPDSSASNRSPANSDNEDEEQDIEDPFAEEEQPRPKPRRRKSDEMEIDIQVEDGEEGERREHIPAELLTVLLHSFFKKEGTRIGKEANRAVGMYMETFVREALARAAWIREEGNNGDGAGDGGGFLEVEDLEKLAPQLLLDF